MTAGAARPGATSGNAALDSELLERICTDMQSVRRAIHAHPETAFEEVQTAGLVAQRLRSCGIEVHEGIAATGVVGVIRGMPGTGAIGLRADMDALHLQEHNTFAHRSTRPGVMHACGHDGHTSMLLGAAQYLQATRRFRGTVFVIFQPAEEGEGGGARMIEEGLFERFEMDAVFGLHNFPGLALGRFAVVAGPMLASFDTFEIVVGGRGGHAAMPHTTVDPIVVGAQLVGALQSIVSRNLDPRDGAVLSVTQFNAGTALNVIPDAAVLRGSVRAFTEPVRELVESRIRALAQGLAQASGATIEVKYERRYPATVNSSAETQFVRAVIDATFGSGGRVASWRPVMASEDFAFMLQRKVGCFALVGNGDAPGGCELHNPRYDFNDGLLSVGIEYWVRLAQSWLADAQGSDLPREPQVLAGHD